jgi:hypothetical protein
LLLAQLHGKVPREFEGMEDVLTSSILGLVKYLPDELACSVLSAFAGLPKLSGAPKIELWPRYPTPAGFGGLAAPPDTGEEAIVRGDTEPDAVITADGWLVFVEAKYRSALDGDYDQLGREYVIGYRQALADGRRFRLVVVTARVCAPTPAGVDLATGLQQAIRANAASLGADAAALIDSVPNALYWTNWQAMYGVISRLHECQDLSGSTRRLLIDMCRLLELRGLRPYSSEPLVRTMARWERDAIPDPVSILSANYRSPMAATLTAGWRSLYSRDLSLLDPLGWGFCSTISVSGYSLAVQPVFDLDPLRNPEWPYAIRKETDS